MSLIGIINSDPQLQSRIEKALAKDKNLSWQSATTFMEALDVLNFDLPEIVLINVSDSNINIDDLIKTIEEDRWLHNFGILGIFDRQVTKEQEIGYRMRRINLLSLMEKSNISQGLLNVLQIIERNRQIIFQWEMTHTLSNRITGSFIIDNDPMTVPIYAGLASTALVQRGYLSVENKRNLQIALAELIQNGIEHGNCEISYEEKSKFLMEGGSIVELVRKKCEEDPSLLAKKVHLEWDIRENETKFYIRDEGKGFDVEEYQKKMQTRKQDSLHGRGIILAKSFGGKLSYNKTGNVALLTVQHEVGEPLREPVGFRGEEVLITREGDVVFREGEKSDHIYYISSGRFKVFREDVLVSLLTPGDIFIGEMSFLLNNKRSATVVAESPGKLIKISRKSFIAAVRDFPQYGIFLSKLLARKLEQNNQNKVRKAEEGLGT